MRSCREPSGADLKHSIISSLVIFRLLGSLSALGSPHTVKRFIDLAIVVRTRGHASHGTETAAHPFRRSGCVARRCVAVVAAAVAVRRITCPPLARIASSVIYVGLGLLFTALVLVLAVQFMDLGGVDRDSDC